MTETAWANDPVIQPLLAVAAADPEIEGLLLGGSRGAGMDDAESDYDLEWVLTDDAYDRRVERGEQLHVSRDPDQPQLDISYACFRTLAQITARASWELPAYSTAQVVYDRAGRAAAALAAMVTMPVERARADVLGWFDAYLNAFYRSLKAWRRGNELGGRLQAAESIMYLVRVLFALERRWPPYHDRLVAQLGSLAGQGWPPDYLYSTLLRLVQTGEPTLQQELELKVEALLRARGYAFSLWEGEIDRVKAFVFNKE